MDLSQKRVDCPIEVGEELIPQEFKYLRVLFTSERKMQHEMDRWWSSSGSGSLPVPVIFKRKISLKVKLWIYCSVYISTPTYVDELWVVTVRKRSWFQAAEMSFLCKMAALRFKVWCTSIPERLRVELQIDRGAITEVVVVCVWFTHIHTHFI